MLPVTDLSPGLAALTVGCDSGDLGSLSRVQLLLLDRGASEEHLEPLMDAEWNSPIEERGDYEPGLQVWSLGIPQHYQCTGKKPIMKPAVQHLPGAGVDKVRCVCVCARVCVGVCLRAHTKCSFSMFFFFFVRNYTHTCSAHAISSFYLIADYRVCIQDHQQLDCLLIKLRKKSQWNKRKGKKKKKQEQENRWHK